MASSPQFKKRSEKRLDQGSYMYFMNLVRRHADIIEKEPKTVSDLSTRTRAIRDLNMLVRRLQSKHIRDVSSL